MVVTARTAGHRVRRDLVADDDRRAKGIRGAGREDARLPLVRAGCRGERNNELSIRGGGPSEIRFQVDGVDRTDALTGNAYTQLNQTLVSEVQVLTGGFNAEYGNVRAGMVNAVLKDGTERGRGPGWSAPWFSGVGAYAPAQRKHFGPGAYDEDQYDYRMMLASNDTMQHYNSRTGVADAFKYGQVYWPLMYAQTATAAQFTNVNSVDNTGAKNYKNPRSSVNLIFEGWQERAAKINALNGKKGAYGKKDWTPEEASAGVGVGSEHERAGLAVRGRAGPELQHLDRLGSAEQARWPSWSGIPIRKR